MNTAVHALDIKDFGQQLARSKDALALRLSLVGILRAALLLARSEQVSRRMVLLLRTSLAMCRNACTGGDCLAGYAQDITFIRDNYLWLAEHLERLPYAFLFRRQVAESLAEWDDLVEDCALGGDPGIRQALSEIADRL